MPFVVRQLQILWSEKMIRLLFLELIDYVDCARDMEIQKNASPNKSRLDHYYKSKFSCVIWATSWQNQQNDLWAQWKLRSAWTSAQSDQSLRCPHEETLGP